MGSFLSSEAPPPPPPPSAETYWKTLRDMQEVDTDKLTSSWREVKWSQKDDLLNEVKDFKPSIERLRILLCGPIGAGKSCFINSVQRVLLGRNAMGALENSSFTGKSFTKVMKIHKLKKGRGEHYPFEIVDIMGLEPRSEGIQTSDIISVLEGRILDEYTFNPVAEITEKDAKYNKDPTFCDKVHCLVNILPGDSVSRMEGNVFEKIKTIRARASLNSTPQVIIMTKVDKTCELVKGDLRKIYCSKKIKDKMNVCSVNIGIPANAIYPVKNYAEQISQDADTDMLVLMALRDILHFANDYVENELEKEAK